MKRLAFSFSPILTFSLSSHLVTSWPGRSLLRCADIARCTRVWTHRERLWGWMPYPYSRRNNIWIRVSIGMSRVSICVSVVFVVVVILFPFFCLVLWFTILAYLVNKESQPGGKLNGWKLYGVFKHVTLRKHLCTASVLHVFACYSSLQLHYTGNRLLSQFPAFQYPNIRYAIKP